VCCGMAVAAVRARFGRDEEDVERERERECGRGAARRATGLTHGWPYLRSV
jgi:hypothetical protein